MGDDLRLRAALELSGVGRSHMDQDETLQAWCDTMAALLALPIEAGDRSVILANLNFIASQVALLEAFPLGDEIEAATIFRA